MMNNHFRNIAIIHAMETACSNINGNALELYRKMNESGDNATLADIGIEPWQPFEHYELKNFAELVESFISTNERILSEAKTQELLEALKMVVADWVADWPFKYIGFEISPNHAITKARAAIAEATSLTS